MTRAQLLAICEPFVRQLAGEVIGLVHAHIEAQLAGVRTSAVEQLTAKLAAFGERDPKPAKPSKPKRKATPQRKAVRAKKPVKPPPAGGEVRADRAQAAHVLAVPRARPQRAPMSEARGSGG